MKSKIVKQIAVAVMMLCAAGCSRNELPDTPGGEPQGERVKVNIGFSVDDFFTPADDSNEAGAKYTTATERVIHSERSGAMLVELVESPLGGEPKPASRAPTVDDNTIANIWLFQYNGTAVTATLTSRTYYNSYTAGMQFDLIKGTDQRIVVVVNSGDTFGNDQIANSSTYQTLLDKTQTVTDEASLFNGNLTPMSATTTGNVSEATNLPMMLRRNVASIVFKVKLGKDGYVPVADTWTIQMCDVPNISYWAPHSELLDTDPQPIDAALGTSVSYAEETVTNMNDNDFLVFNWFVPMNRRGTVASTTPKTRKTNAPAKSTYVKVTGTRESIDDKSVITTTITSYSIHLGADFTTDYNLKPNYRYTYNVTLYTDPDNTDSCVEEVTVEGIYIGMFGGELVNNGGVWAFTKGLYVDVKAGEITGKKWSTAEGVHSALAGSVSDGKGNTWRMYDNNSTQFEAAAACMAKNGTVTSITDPNYIWFLPAQDQLIATWVAHSAFDITQSFAPFCYWSATESSSSNAWYVNFSNDYTGNKVKTETTDFMMRCVREL